jgi:hypothetical protein
MVEGGRIGYDLTWKQEISSVMYALDQAPLVKQDLYYLVAENMLQFDCPFLRL